MQKRDEKHIMNYLDRRLAFIIVEIRKIDILKG